MVGAGSVLKLGRQGFEVRGGGEGAGDMQRAGGEDLPALGEGIRGHGGREKREVRRKERSDDAPCEGERRGADRHERGARSEATMHHAKASEEELIVTKRDELQILHARVEDELWIQFCRVIVTSLTRTRQEGDTAEDEP